MASAFTSGSSVMARRTVMMNPMNSRTIVVILFTIIQKWQSLNDWLQTILIFTEACDPVSRPCGKVDGKDPKIPYFLAHWRCDGENDCGNGFDEFNCGECRSYWTIISTCIILTLVGRLHSLYMILDSRVPGKSCGRAHLNCSGNGSRIPFAYQCDGQPDCPSGEDEQNCSKWCWTHVQFIYVLINR